MGMFPVQSDRRSPHDSPDLAPSPLIILHHDRLLPLHDRGLDSRWTSLHDDG